MTKQDIPICNNIHKTINKYNRTKELEATLQDDLLFPHVIERNDKIVGYSSGFTYPLSTRHASYSARYFSLAYQDTAVTLVASTALISTYFSLTTRRLTTDKMPMRKLYWLNSCLYFPVHCIQKYYVIVWKWGMLTLPHPLCLFFSFIYSLRLSKVDFLMVKGEYSPPLAGCVYIPSILW